MSNPVMNYNQFMSAFKKASAGYSGKADIKNSDKNGTAKVKQDLAENPAKTKGTAAIDKYTKQYLATVKKKNVVSSK